MTTRRILSPILLLAALLLSAASVQAQQPVPPAQPAPDYLHSPYRQPEPPVPMATPQQVESVVAHLRSLSFDSDKLKAAKLCAQLRPFSIDALAAIAQTFSWDDSRLEFLTFALPFSPERDDYERLAPVFRYRNTMDKFFKSQSR